MKAKIVIPKPERAQDGLTPVELARLQFAKSGPRAPHPALENAGYDQVELISAMIVREGSRGRLLLLFFLEGHDAPFAAPAQTIVYGKPINTREELLAQFRKMTAAVARQCPRLTLDRETYAFLEGKPPATTQVPLAVMAAALAREIGRGQEPKTDEDLDETIFDEGFDPTAFDKPTEPASVFDDHETKPAPPLDPQPAESDSIFGEPAAESDSIFGEPAAEPDSIFGEPSPEDAANAEPAAGTGSIFDEPPSQPSDSPDPQTGGADAIACPNCGFVQPAAAECARCGVIIAKFLERKRRQEERETASQAPPPLPDAASAGEEPPPLDGGLAPQPEDAAEAGASSDYRPPWGLPEDEASEPPPRQPEFYAEPDQPGIGGERFVSVDSIVMYAVQTVRNHFLPLLGIAAPLLFLHFGVVFVASLLFGSNSAMTGLVQLGAGLYFYTLTLTVMIYFMNKVLERGSCTLGEAYNEGFQRSTAAFVSRLGSFLMIILGFICFLIPGVIYAIRYIFIEAAAAVEDPDKILISKMSISRNLAARYGFSIFGAIVTVYFLIMGIVYIPALAMFFLALLASPITLAGGGGLTALNALMILFVVFISSIVAFIFLAAAIHAMYLELKEIHGEHALRSPTEVDLLTKVVLVVDAVIVVLFFMVVMRLLSGVL